MTASSRRSGRVLPQPDQRRAGPAHPAFGIRGYATSVHTACASGGQAVGTALKVMRRGGRLHARGRLRLDDQPDRACRASACWARLSTDNDTPERASRPFDATRNGFVLGEGAGFLVLEDGRRPGGAARASTPSSRATAIRSAATASPIRHPAGDGPIQAMQQALADAGATPEDVDYINAHGTSTSMNDRSECAAMHAVLGDTGRRVAVSSTKSCMGHLIAAAGAVEAAVCALAIRDGDGR